MDADLLRRACEAAGLEMDADDIFDECVDIDGEFGLFLEHPALPAYAASRLVAKVLERGGDAEDAYDEALSRLTESDVVHVCHHITATDEQRIRAALEVLEVGNER